MTGPPGKALLLLCCLAAGPVAQADTNGVYIHPTITGYAEHYTNSWPPPDSWYNKHYGDIRYGGMWAPHYRYDYYAFLKSSLDSLPDSCAILQAELNYYQYESYGPQVDVGLIRDPEPLNPSDLLVEIRDAPAITPIRASPNGWVTLPFDTASFSLLDSCRRSGWSSFGLRSAENHWGFAYGYDGDSTSYLRVVCDVPGTEEPSGATLWRPEFAIVPNPASGRFVILRCDIAAGIRGKLTLRDVLGRPAKSFVPDPSGSTYLDLRGLAPGVYMATLDGTMPLVSSKLVITR